jgi:carboxypeptidase Q
VARVWPQTETGLGLTIVALQDPRARPATPPSAPSVEAYHEVAARILTAARADGRAWARLTEMTDTFGHRLSGSETLEAAIRWAAQQMARDGLEHVRLEPVKVPHWVRGRESLELVSLFAGELVMLGLGHSVGTPPTGIEAEVLVVTSFQELEARATEAHGRIVLFNAPFVEYGTTVRYRTAGASAAARHGARAALIRSVGPTGLRTPHTGVLSYEGGVPQIPAAALAAEDADRLQRLAARGQRIVVRLRMEAHALPDADSANVVAEWRGREKPHEVVVLGGHIDSWDVGTGAMDDAGGCVVTWHAVSLLKALGLRPRRTLRVVLWTNEENGQRGGIAYRDRYADQLKDHILALESDSGMFRPTGFGFSGNDRARATVHAIAALLAPIGASHVGPSGHGVDIAPIVEAGGIPAMSLLGQDDRYFLYHHTAADTIDHLDAEEVALNVAAVAVMVYAVAELPERLGASGG